MITEDFIWEDCPFLSIDTETTGFSKEDRIIEIAIVVQRGPVVLETFHSLVNPEGRSIGEGAYAVHGISDDDVANAPTFEEIKPRVLELLCRDIPWVAHQMNFDARMLSYVISKEEWPRDIPTLCSMEFAKKKHPSLKMYGKHKLLDLAGYLHINYDPGMAHNAMNDAELLAKIVPAMMRDRPVLQHFTKYSHEWLK